jgi:TrmH family RNA methyltransferase
MSGANGETSADEGGETPDCTPAVVVVDAETPGTVGTIARAMKNFGLADLRLVDPPELDPGGEAYGFAGHAREDVLPNATETTLDAVIEEFFTVGCTAITGEDARRHVRYPFVTPTELADELAAVDTRPALVFGRESTGLSNAELERLDRVCSIPASDDYPVLNLGQAATVLLYELRSLTVDETQLPDPERERAEEGEIERLYGYLDDLLAASAHRNPDRVSRLVRRVVGRAHPTDREVHTLLGVFRRVNRQLEHRRKLIERYDETDHYLLDQERATRGSGSLEGRVEPEGPPEDPAESASLSADRSGREKNPDER